MPILSTLGAASSRGFGLLGKSLPVFEIVISSDTTNYNLYNAAIAAGWPGAKDINLNATLNSGVSISSTSPGTTAFDVGSPWPINSRITFNNNGLVVGRGGNGGNSGFGPNSPGSPGLAGSTAFNTTRPVNIINNNRIAGGGGGGGGGAGVRFVGKISTNRGGGGGGGGIGNSTGGIAIQPAPGASDGTGGTLTTAGTGGTGVTPTNFGGNGGGYGSAGIAGGGQTPPGGSLIPGGAAGAAGAAIVGYSYVTISGAGVVNGPTSG